MAQYTHTTFSTAKSTLGEMLHDSGNVYWTDAEKGVYIVEALRTWGAMCWYWRGRDTFPATSGTAFYDLTTALSGILRRYTVTDQDLVRDIQYHLLEPATGSSWTGTEQFILADLTNSLNRRRNQFLSETGTVLTQSTTNLVPPALGRVALSDSVIDVRRAAWNTPLPFSVTTILDREDEWSATAHNPGWANTPATPESYSVAVTPTLEVQLIPVPISNGLLDLITVNTGPTLNPAVGVVLNIPDDFSWIVKWGAMADLLGKDGQARDPARAAYCEQRWRDGLEIAKIGVSVLQAQVNGVPIEMDSLHQLDCYDTRWQNHTGTPSLMAMAGLNLVALAKVPDGNYGVTVDLVRNAPIPVAGTDNIQVGREELEAILGYAEHLAAFKMGGAEFEATMPHYKRFMQLAMLRNERFRAVARNLEALQDKATKEETERKRRQEIAA